MAKRASPPNKVPKTPPTQLRHYVRATHLARLLDVHVATVWRWAACGTIPPPRHLGEGVTVWSWPEVRQALEQRSAATQ